MLLEIHIITQKGESILSKSFNENNLIDVASEFIQIINSSTAAPIFKYNDHTYVWNEVADVYLLAYISDAAISSNCCTPADAFEFLNRFEQTIIDFTGTVSEECVRRNHVLLLELLQELALLGFVQNTETSDIRQRVHSSSQLPTSESSWLLQLPVTIKQATTSSLNNIGSSINTAIAQLAATTNKESGAFARAATSAAEKLVGKTLPTVNTQTVVRTISQAPPKVNEVFVDILEKVVATLDSSGTITNATILGEIGVSVYVADSVDIKLLLKQPLKFTSDQISLDQNIDHSQLFSQGLLSFRGLPDYPSVPLILKPTVVCKEPGVWEIVVTGSVKLSDNQELSKVSIIIPLPENVEFVKSRTSKRVGGNAVESSATALVCTKQNYVVWSINSWQTGNIEFCLLRVHLKTKEAIIYPVELSASFSIVKSTFTGCSISALRVSYINSVSNISNAKDKAISKWIRYAALAEDYKVRMEGGRILT